MMLIRFSYKVKRESWHLLHAEKNTYGNMRVEVEAELVQSSLDLAEGFANELKVVQSARI